MELNAKIKDALIKIDFIKRYEELSSNFDAQRTPLSEGLDYVDRDEVMDMIRNLGYSPMFNTKEKFYKIKEEQIGAFSFGFHISLRYSVAELIWVVREDGKLLLGDPWAIYSRLMIDVNYQIKPPIFGTYEDLEDILKIAFEMYEDFKCALLNIPFKSAEL